MHIFLCFHEYCWSKADNSLNVYIPHLSLRSGSWQVSSPIGAPVLSQARTGWNWVSSLLYGTRLPLGQQGATQKMDCTADLLLIVVWDSEEQHREWNGMSILFLAPRCPRGSLVPYKSEEHQFCRALLTERTVCGMSSPASQTLEKSGSCAKCTKASFPLAHNLKYSKMVGGIALLLGTFLHFCCWNIWK